MPEKTALFHRAGEKCGLAEFVLAKPTPLSLAFDVFVITEVEAIEIGTVAWAKGTQGSASMRRYPWGGRYPIIPNLPDDVMLELRASRASASLTLDCFDIWNGTLRLGPVRIEPAQSTNQ
jgi:hypothetical protein